MSSLPPKNIELLTLDITLKGGIERFVVNMANLLAESGFTVTVYSFHKTHDKCLYPLSPDVLVVYLTQLPYLNSGYKWVTFWCCLRYVWSRRSQRNCTVISTYPITTIFLCLLSRKLVGNLIASEHSTYLAHNRLVRMLRLICYRRVKYIVTQTTDGVEKFALSGLKALKIANPVTDFLDDRQWKFVPRLENQTFSCLTIARFEEVKQLDHFIKVASLVHQQCPEVIFELVGAGPCQSALHQQVSLMGLEDVVVIRSPTADVNHFYARASVYIITSYSEAFPMTMIEALSFAVPVCAYNQLTGPSEIIRSGENGFLCHQNEPDSIAEKIILLIHEPGRHNIMKKKSLESAEQFRKKSILEKWLTIL